MLDDLEDAARLSAEAVDLAERRGDVVALSENLCGVGYVASLRGRAGADAILRRAEDLGSTAAWGWRAIGWPSASQAGISLWTDRPERAMTRSCGGFENRRFTVAMTAPSPQSPARPASRSPNSSLAGGRTPRQPQPKASTRRRRPASRPTRLSHCRHGRWSVPARDTRSTREPTRSRRSRSPARWMARWPGFTRTGRSRCSTSSSSAQSTPPNDFGCAPGAARGRRRWRAGRDPVWFRRDRGARRRPPGLVRRGGGRLARGRGQALDRASALAGAQRGRGLLAAAAGAQKAAIAAFERAVEQHARVTMPFERAHAAASRRRAAKGEAQAGGAGNAQRGAGRVRGARRRAVESARGRRAGPHQRAAPSRLRLSGDRATDRRAGGRGPDEQGGRGGAVPEPQNRGGPLAPGVSEARGTVTHRACAPGPRRAWRRGGARSQRPGREAPAGQSSGF